MADTMTARRFGKQAVARNAAAEAHQAELHRARQRRLAAQDRAYARALAANPEGNNRSKGAAPMGRLRTRRGGATQRGLHQNHSSGSSARPHV